MCIRDSTTEFDISESLAITFNTKFESLRLGPLHAGNLDLRRDNKWQSRKEQNQQAGLKEFVFKHRCQPPIEVGFSLCLASKGADRPLELSVIQSVRERCMNLSPSKKRIRLFPRNSSISAFIICIILSASSFDVKRDTTKPVSYTHLTLPTKRNV